ncbi:orotate phosphoribosyltransferase [Luteolibacter yonseiensis]
MRSPAPLTSKSYVWWKDPVGSTPTPSASPMFDVASSMPEVPTRAMLHTASALKNLLLQKSVRTGTFTLASGKESDLYIDCRMTALDPFGANLIGDLGWHAVRSKIHSEQLQIDAIGGMTLGADPISLAVGMTSALRHPDEALQVFTVRKEPKGHGAGKQIEGNFKSGANVIVVDDVITTGGSTLKAIDAIEREGGKVAFALVLVDREEGGRQAIEARGIHVISLFSRSTLLDE